MAVITTTGEEEEEEEGQGTRWVGERAAVRRRTMGKRRTVSKKVRIYESH